ncbi:hypothetical protein MUK42_25932 [Musa troglodytarum]|uniref:Uncharacterized protein n=1 Tax=Musa troglodytarum TaxID=320322 RepID=A0A9E7J8W0_9LILI|nr:hypothetical protein MUK42_25932 [Musa troglodytarum]
MAVAEAGPADLPPLTLCSSCFSDSISFLSPRESGALLLPDAENGGSSSGGLFPWKASEYLLVSLQFGPAWVRANWVSLSVDNLILLASCERSFSCMEVGGSGAYMNRGTVRKDLHK